MMGQDLLVPFVSFDKRDSPEGAKQDLSAHAEAAQKRPNKKSIAEKLRSYESKAMPAISRQ